MHSSLAGRIRSMHTRPGSMYYTVVHLLCSIMRWVGLMCSPFGQTQREEGDLSVTGRLHKSGGLMGHPLRAIISGHSGSEPIGVTNTLVLPTTTWPIFRIRRCFRMDGFLPPDSFVLSTALRQEISIFSLFLLALIAIGEEKKTPWLFFFYYTREGRKRRRRKRALLNPKDPDENDECRVRVL